MKILFICGFMLASTVLANLLMKIGADGPPEDRILGLLSPKTIAGLFFFGMAGLMYAFLLRLIPLNVAQSIMASQYLAVILAAALVLSEPIPPIRWVGILMIFIGIFVVTRTT